MVVVIEQVALSKIRVWGGLTGDQRRDHIGTKLCLFSSCAPVHHCHSPSMYPRPTSPEVRLSAKRLAPLGTHTR